MSKQICFEKCLKTIKIIYSSYFWCNLLQSLGAGGTNEISPKVLLVMVVGSTNCISDYITVRTLLSNGKIPVPFETGIPRQDQVYKSHHVPQIPMTLR